MSDNDNDNGNGNGDYIEISGIRHFITSNAEELPTDTSAGSRAWIVSNGDNGDYEAREYIFDGTEWVLIVYPGEVEDAPSVS